MESGVDGVNVRPAIVLLIRKLHNATSAFVCGVVKQTVRLSVWLSPVCRFWGHRCSVAQGALDCIVIHTNDVGCVVV